MWMLFQAGFANFGFAGQFGVAVGMISSATAVLELVISLMYSDAPTALAISLSPRCLRRCEGAGAETLGSALMVLMSVAAGLTFVIG